MHVETGVCLYNAGDWYSEHDLQSGGSAFEQ